jgi:hypothetical protein
VSRVSIVKDKLKALKSSENAFTENILSNVPAFLPDLEAKGKLI